MSPGPCLRRPLVVVTGKGGTGKTTVAAALGLAAAAAGLRVVVCEVGGRQGVPGLFGRRPPRPGEELELEPGLATVSIEPQVALEEWLGRQLPRRLIGALARSGAFGAFTAAAPGVRELVSVTKAWELGAAERWRRGARPYDVVVLDAPATGHGLGLLRTPRTFADIARVGPIAGQAREVDAALRDPGRTACVAVTLPGELPVSETLELEDTVGERLGRGLDAVVVNGLLPRRIARAELERLAALDGRLPRGAFHAAHASAGRVATQSAQLARLRRHAAAPVLRLPFLFTERLVAEDLRGLARRLASDERPERTQAG